MFFIINKQKKEEQEMNKRNKKIFSSATAMVAVLAILVSGTLAFLGGVVATNSFRDVIIPPQEPDLTGANLHDDFAGMIGVDALGVTNKDVYVENTGDKDVFVRIKLTEVLNGASQLFIPRINSSGEIVVAGNTTGFEWKLGSTMPKNYNSIKETAQWDNTLNPGEQTELVADVHGEATVASKADTSVVSIPAGQTLDQDGVISMTKYIKLNDAQKIAFVGWIYDVDGYAYWSQALEPNTATGLLLDSVKVPEIGTRTYEYDIVVDMEYTDKFDVDAWLTFGTDGERKIVINGDKQWNKVLTNADGGVIKNGAKAGQTTIEASSEAKQVLRDITERSVIPAGLGVLSHDKTGNGNWVEISRNGEYSLIVKSDVTGVEISTIYCDGDEYIPYGLLDTSDPDNLRSKMNYWYDNALDSDARMRSFTVGHDALTKVGTWGDVDDPDGFSEPTGVAVSSDVAFPLSYQEAANYLSYRYYTTSYQISSATAFENWQKLEYRDITTGLRSPGSNPALAANLNTTGSVSNNNTHASYVLRPAVWVHSSIFR